MQLEAVNVKTWLLRYGEQQKNLDMLIERRDLLQYKVGGARTAIIDGLPHGSTRNSDVIGDMVAALEALEAEVEAERARGRELYHEIEAAIKQIKGKRFPEQRAILRIRYLDLESWETAVFMLFGRRDNFEDRYASYQRRAYQIHRDALEALAQVVYPTITEK